HLVVYETVANKQIKSRLNNIFETATVDYITFMSRSRIRRFVELLDKRYHAEALEIQVICIGMTTEKREDDHGLEHVSILSQVTADSMLAKIVEIERMNK